MKCYDKIIIGAGLYGLYSAVFAAKRDEKVLVLECDERPFSRATYINQARVHMGYHYPRSLSTAAKSHGYFEQFCNDYPDSIKNDFTKVYATSANYSFTNAACFKKFCNDCSIPCTETSPDSYFKPGLCDGCFVTKEYTYDHEILLSYLQKDMDKMQGNIDILYNTEITSIKVSGERYEIALKTGECFGSGFVLNSTYASVNQLNYLAGFDTFPIKYELCEIILCRVNGLLDNVGITVMDGPFFSIMPFGKSGLHSLTSVTFTPHITSYERLPNFSCMQKAGDYCSPHRLGNCNSCEYKPKTAYGYMSQLARKYLKDVFSFDYHSSLFSVKPILKLSEIDDSRPTVIKTLSKKPTFVSVLSGKINTVYDLMEVLSSE